MFEPWAGTQPLCSGRPSREHSRGKNSRVAGVTEVHVSKYGIGTWKVPTVLPFETGLIMPKTKQVAELTAYYNVERGSEVGESVGVGAFPTVLVITSDGRVYMC